MEEDNFPSQSSVHTYSCLDVHSPQTIPRAQSLPKDSLEKTEKALNTF